MKKRLVEPIQFDPNLKVEHIRVLHIPAAVGDGDPGGSTDPEKGAGYIETLIRKQGFQKCKDGIYRRLMKGTK